MVGPAASGLSDKKEDPVSGPNYESERHPVRGMKGKMNPKSGQVSSRPHVLRDKRGLVNRTRRLRGQVDAIERALDGEASCSDLLQRITAARGAINGLMAEVLEEHVREYLIEDGGPEAVSREEAAEELIEIIHSYLT